VIDALAPALALALARVVAGGVQGEQPQAAAVPAAQAASAVAPGPALVAGRLHHTLVLDVEAGAGRADEGAGPAADAAPALLGPERAVEAPRQRHAEGDTVEGLLDRRGLRENSVLRQRWQPAETSATRASPFSVSTSAAWPPSVSGWSSKSLPFGSSGPEPSAVQKQNSSASVQAIETSVVLARRALKSSSRESQLKSASSAPKPRASQGRIPNTTVSRRSAAGLRARRPCLPCGRRGSARPSGRRRPSRRRQPGRRKERSRRLLDGTELDPRPDLPRCDDTGLLALRPRRAPPGRRA